MRWYLALMCLADLALFSGAARAQVAGLAPGRYVLNYAGCHGGQGGAFIYTGAGKPGSVVYGGTAEALFNATSYAGALDAWYLPPVPAAGPHAGWSGPYTHVYTTGNATGADTPITITQVTDTGQVAIHLQNLDGSSFFATMTFTNTNDEICMIFMNASRNG
jgi:hypothetical protein